MRFFLVLTTAAAFHAAAPRLSASRPAGAAKVAPRAAPVMMMPPGLALAPAARLVASVPVLYALMSVNEYVTHRYYQHAGFNDSPFLQAVFKPLFALAGKEVPKARGGGHVEHHAETLDDMTLKTDDRWRGTAVAKSLDPDPFRGTGFTWPVAGLMTVQMLPTTIPVFTGLLGWSLAQTVTILLPGMLVHTAVWNALHPNMHALPDVPILVGPPSWLFSWARNTWYFRFLYANHVGHHVVGGRGNYNVACPGTDHLVGTFVPEKVWKPRAKSDYASHHGQDVSVDQQIKNHIAREKFGLSSDKDNNKNPALAATTQAAAAAAAAAKSPVKELVGA